VGGKAVNTVSERLAREIDTIAKSVPCARTMASELSEISHNLIVPLDTLEIELRTLLAQRLIQTNRPAREQVAKALERIERLRELRNMMELGSFEIQVNRAMQAAWEVLP
jgi:K+-sensing histidine kinase KdpD